MKIILTGGGTGGHIYPALALMRRIKETNPDAEFLYVGTHNGLENKIVPENDVPFDSVNIQGFKRSLSFYNVKTIFLFGQAFFKSKKILKQFKPDVVIGTGGYVCGPVVFAAARMHIPAVIHEQNSVAGLTNKFLGNYVDKIAICFEEVKDQFGKNINKVVYTGNPRAQEVASITENDSLKEYGLLPHVPTVLLFSGSRGAAKINEAIAEAAPKLFEKEYQVLVVTGESYFEEMKAKIGGTTLEKVSNFKMVPYISKLPQVFADVSLAVSRSGATTLSEVTALGLPTILIPSPNVTEDHQTKNAMSLVNKGAAKIIPEDRLTGDKLIDEIDRMMQDKHERDAMAKAAKKAGVPDAADRLANVLYETAGIKREG